MKTENRRLIQEAIQKLSGVWGKAWVKICDVNIDSVDKDNKTCVVSSIDDGKLIEGLTVRLMLDDSDGEYDIPTVNTTATIIFSDYTEPYVVKKTWLDEKFIIIGNQSWDIKDGQQTFNDGAFGGLTKTLELQTQINKLNTLVSHLINIINGTVINEPGSGSPSALQAALKGAITSDSVGDFSNIENKSITHGEKLK